MMIFSYFARVFTSVKKGFSFWADKINICDFDKSDANSQ
jgi:hypothetical protein